MRERGDAEGGGSGVEGLDCGSGGEGDGGEGLERVRGEVRGERGGCGLDAECWAPKWGVGVDGEKVG